MFYTRCCVCLTWYLNRFKTESKPLSRLNEVSRAMNFESIKPLFGITDCMYKLYTKGNNSITNIILSKQIQDWVWIIKFGLKTYTTLDTIQDHIIIYS